MRAKLFMHYSTSEQARSYYQHITELPYDPEVQVLDEITNERPAEAGMFRAYGHPIDITHMFTRRLAEHLRSLFPVFRSGTVIQQIIAQWKFPPIVFFEATTPYGDHFARFWQFFRPMGVSKDGNRIYGFMFSELKQWDRMDPDDRSKAERFLSYFVASD
ncbi:MAG: hypothetical protein AMXMBFR58_10230 [Phycisphaerae bacterium]